MMPCRWIHTPHLPIAAVAAVTLSLLQAIAAAWEAEAAEAEAAEAEAAQEEAAVAEAAQPANWHTQAIPLGLYGDAVPFAHAVPKSAMAAAAVAEAKLVTKAAMAAAAVAESRLVSKAAVAAPRGAKGKGKAAAMAGEAQPWESKGKGIDIDDMPLLSLPPVPPAPWRNAAAVAKTTALMWGGRPLPPSNHTNSHLTNETNVNC